MNTLTILYSAIYQFGDNFAYLVLSALGLAIIFGMMGVINLAHGDLIMCGAYVTIISAKTGIPLPVAMALGTLAAAIAGVLVERLVLLAGGGLDQDCIAGVINLSERLLVLLDLDRMFSQEEKELFN